MCQVPCRARRAVPRTFRATLRCALRPPSCPCACSLMAACLETPTCPVLRPLVFDVPRTRSVLSPRPELAHIRPRLPGLQATQPRLCAGTCACVEAAVLPQTLPRLHSRPP